MGAPRQDRTFVAKFDELLERRGWSGERRSIWGFVDSYEALVVQCERGYAWTIYEFENELDERLRSVFMEDVEVGSNEQYVVATRRSEGGR